MNYTWAKNLLKTHDMQTGAVSYKNTKLVVKLICEKDKDIVRATMKTKTESFPDFAADYQNYLWAQEKKENAIKLKGKIATEEEEKAAKDIKAAKKGEWDEFFGGQDQEEAVMAGGNNKFLDDDFM